MLKKFLGVAAVAAGVAAMAIPAGAAARAPKVHVTRREGVVHGKAIDKQPTRGLAQVAFDGTNFSVSVRMTVNTPGAKYFVQVDQYDKVDGRITQVSSNVGCEMTTSSTGVAVCTGGDLGPMAGHWAARTYVGIVAETDHARVATGLVHA